MNTETDGIHLGGRSRLNGGRLSAYLAPPFTHVTCHATGLALAGRGRKTRNLESFAARNLRVIERRVGAVSTRRHRSEVVVCPRRCTIRARNASASGDRSVRCRLSCGQSCTSRIFHFGRLDQARGRPLVAAIGDVAPDLVAVSGDFPACAPAFNSPKPATFFRRCRALAWWCRVITMCRSTMWRGASSGRWPAIGASSPTIWSRCSSTRKSSRSA